MTEARPSIAFKLLSAALALDLLFCVLFPAVNGTPSRRTICRNNLHLIGIALHNYHDVHDSFPPAYTPDDRGRPIHSWRVHALPYIDQAPLYNMYDMSEPWNGPNNTAVAESFAIPLDYQCPVDVEEREIERPWTSYLAVVGPHTGWPGDRPAGISEFTDGAANTALVVESHNTGIHWMEPRDLHVTQMPTVVNPAFGQGISSAHEGGAFVMFADGTVRFLANNLDVETLRRLIERADGEEVQGF